MPISRGWAQNPYQPSKIPALNTFLALTALKSQLFVSDSIMSEFLLIMVSMLTPCKKTLKKHSDFKTNIG